MTYADYDFYTTVYLGNMIPTEEEFDRYAMRASMDIDYLTMGKAAHSAELPAVKMACCAAAEQYMVMVNATVDATHGELKSESVGSYSRTYATSAERMQSARAAVNDSIYRYLVPTGLLYRGL